MKFSPGQGSHGLGVEDVNGSCCGNFEEAKTHLVAGDQGCSQREGDLIWVFEAGREFG